MSLNFTPPGPLNTAVLLLVFNRPDVTAQVFEAIRQARPPRLYVAADGPREERNGEAERVAKVREIAISVDWPCEVKTLFRKKNLGCKYAVSGAINWFFEHEEQGIILEDDCLPSLSFFWFCEELLNEFKFDSRVFMVSGYNNFGIYGDRDYFFSNIGGIWGWASWRRAWKLYEVEPNSILKKHKNDFSSLVTLLGRKTARARIDHWKALVDGLDTWDFQWSFIRHFNNGLSCVPRNNLVSNIGFGEEATHTKTTIKSIPKFDIQLPLQKNLCFIANRHYDEGIHSSANVFKKVLRVLIKAVKKYV